MCSFLLALLLCPFRKFSDLVDEPLRELHDTENDAIRLEKCVCFVLVVILGKYLNNPGF